MCRHHTITGRPGVGPCTQTLERMQREQHRVLPRGSSHVNAIKFYYPKAMKIDAGKNTGPITRVLPHTPTVIYQEAMKYTVGEGSNLEGKGNMFIVSSDTDFSFIYSNRVPLIKGGLPVTAERCEVHYQCLVHGINPRNVRTVPAWEKACLSLVEVCISHDVATESNHETEGHSCDCADFWLMRTCPHLLAACTS